MRRLLLFALSLVGLFISLYLLWVYTSPSHPLVCLGTGCDTVRASPYAHVMGYPMPMFGVLMYSAVALLLFAEPLVASWTARRIRSLVLVILSAAFLCSVYLTGLEAFAIHAWCEWCVTSAIVITLMLALAIWEALRPESLSNAETGIARRFSAARTQFALFVVGLAIGIPAFVYLSRSGELPAAPPTSAEVLNTRLVRPDSHATGNLGSPVMVVEFGDFECPICGTEQPTVDAIRRAYGSQVKFVFREFPLTKLHPQAEKAAEAAECADAQGQEGHGDKFWEMADALYANQADLSETALERYAAGLGLDQGRFHQCLSSGSMAARVQEDVDDARALQVRGTPTFYIGGQSFLRAIPYPEFASLIDSQLALHPATTGEAGVATGLSGQIQSASTSPSAAAPNQAGQPATDKPAGSPNTTPVKPKPGTAASGTDSGKAAGALGGGSSPFGAANPFSQAAASGTVCSEDEANKKQAALIHTSEAHELFEAKALFLDVRPANEFASEHISGALSIPVDDLNQRWSSLPMDKTIVLYESGRGSSGDICAAGRAGGRILLEHGFSFDRVKVYQDGLADWQRAGFAVEH
ncbi:MAG TPA: thioredoxin domain-containing protein [Terriglobia bacterium]|nr:thioredoxin domain-containing protein [Terriglobia bacterium]